MSRPGGRASRRDSGRDVVRVPIPLSPSPGLLRAILVSILALSACGGAADHVGDEGLQAELQLSPTPPMVGTAGVRVRATDGGEVVPPPGAVNVRVEGGVAEPRELVFEDAAWTGSLDFPAAGEVRVVVEVVAPDGRRATVTVPVRVVRRP